MVYQTLLGSFKAFGGAQACATCWDQVLLDAQSFWHWLVRSMSELSARRLRSGLHMACDVWQGLALPGLSKASGGRPAFWHMLDLGLLDARTFSLWLNPNVSELAAGEIRFGGASADRHTGQLVDLPVVSDKCAPVHRPCYRPCPVPMQRRLRGADRGCLSRAKRVSPHHMQTLVEQCVTRERARRLRHTAVAMPVSLSRNALTPTNLSFFHTSTKIIAHLYSRGFASARSSQLVPLPGSHDQSAL